MCHLVLLRLASADEISCRFESDGWWNWSEKSKTPFALVSKIQYCSTHSYCVFQTEEASSTGGGGGQKGGKKTTWGKIWKFSYKYSKKGDFQAFWRQFCQKSLKIAKFNPFSRRSSPTQILLMLKPPHIKILGTPLSTERRVTLTLWYPSACDLIWLSAFNSAEAQKTVTRSIFVRFGHSTHQNILEFGPDFIFIWGVWRSRIQWICQEISNIWGFLGWLHFFSFFAWCQDTMLDVPIGSDILRPTSLGTVTGWRFPSTFKSTDAICMMGSTASWAFSPISFADFP